MPQTIWKAVLEPADLQKIDVPFSAELLCAREQHDQICIWFKCDPGVQKEARSVSIVGTGHPAPDGNVRYLGTASLHGGQLMFHVFEHVPAVSS